jgi:hypothetical protein
VAALRRQLVAAVTPEVMAQVCTALILRAQGGNLAAIKLLFSYVLGQPTEIVNPDAMDREEMEQYRRDIGMDELMGKVLLGVPADFACECARAARPDIIERLIEKAAHGGAAASEADDGRASLSANGLNRGPQGDHPPGGDGGDAPIANPAMSEKEDVIKTDSERRRRSDVIGGTGGSRRATRSLSVGGRRHLLANVVYEERAPTCLIRRGDPTERHGLPRP